VDINNLTSDVISCVHEAGRFLQKERLRIDEADIGIKGPGDFVSQADRTAESMLKERLLRILPGSVFMGEENSPDVSGGDGWRWIVDPLDGTTNYLQGIPIYAISVALEDRRKIKSNWGDITLAVVHLPELDLTFDAIRGGGARKNGAAIQVRQISDFSRVVLATGFPFRNKDVVDQYLAVFKSMTLKVGNIRRIGSAAVDLAWLASGTFDGFWEVGLKPWDIAAGILLIEEAGGIVTDFRGGNPLENGWIVAGSKNVYDVLFEVINEHFPERIFI